MEVVVTYRKDCPAHNQVIVSICSSRLSFEEVPGENIKVRECQEDAICYPEIPTDSLKVSTDMFYIPPAAFKY